MKNNSRIGSLTKKDDGGTEHEELQWLKDNTNLLILFILIVLLVLMIVVIVIICKKKRRRSNTSGTSLPTRHDNNKFNSLHTECINPGTYSCCNGNFQPCSRCRYPPCMSSPSIYSHGNACSRPYIQHSCGSENMTQERSRNVHPVKGFQSVQRSHLTSYDNQVAADYSDWETEDDVNETALLSVPNQELFTNIPPELLSVFPRSKTIIVQNKEVVFISRRVTEKGDNLVLDKMGISLFVPPGAVKCGEMRTIVLVLNWDLGDNPSMTEKQALVSPVVYVGPHDLKLDKPCTLSFKHCSFDTRHITVMKSETELIEQKEWMKHCSADKESGECVLTPDECQLKINSFTLYTCLQSPNGSDESKKWLQVAAFSSPLKSSITHQQIRLYFLNKTPCALQWAIQNEAKFGGQMMGPEKVYLFYGNAQDMFICLRYLSDGWDNVDKEVEERIPYINIWHGKCPHVTMCFKKNSIPRELTFKLYLYQYLLENDGGNFIAHVTEENKQTLFLENGSGSSKQEIIVNLPSNRNNFNNTDDSSVFSPNVEHQVHFHFQTPEEIKLDKVESASSHFYPHDLKIQLKVLLDPPSPFDRDWKALATALGREKCIRYMTKADSPTESLLCDAETKMISLETLRDIFLAIQRKDAAEVVQGYIPQRNRDDDRRSRPSPSENTFNFSIEDQ